MRSVNVGLILHNMTEQIWIQIQN